MRASRSGAIASARPPRAPRCVADIPIGLSRERFWLYGIALAIASATVIIGGVHSEYGDWPGYVRAGRTAGTAALLHPQAGVFPFLYVPAFAWLFVPVAQWGTAAGYALNGVLMAACATAAATLMAATHRVRTGPAILMTFAWSPIIYSIAIGQTSDLGLMLASACTFGLTRGSLWITAIPAALLLFKPTYAAPLLIVMLVRARWRELGLAAIAGCAIYIASVAAAADDWRWPVSWARAIVAWLPLDNVHSGVKLISTTSLLAHMGAGSLVIAAFVVLTIAAVVPLLRRVPVGEACALAMAFGVVLSAHALTYEAVMLLPLAFVAATRLREPFRTRVVAITYLSAACAPYADVIGANSLLPIVPVAAFGWLWLRYRGSAVIPLDAPDRSCELA